MGQERLFGQLAIRITSQDPKAKERFISSRLRDFRCFEIQTFHQVKNEVTGDWDTVAGKRLTAFADANPNPESFTYWNAYTEMKPSDLNHTLLRANGITPLICAKCFEDDVESDKAYQQWNQ